MTEKPLPILGKALAQPTQVKRPWRTTARTVFQGIVGAAAMAAPVYEAATHHDAAAATGWAATGLAISAGVTRVMAVPMVNDWLARFLPFLAAQPKV
jgi:predicted phage tail protein